MTTEPMGRAPAAFHRRRHLKGAAFAAFALMATLVGVVALAVLLVDVTMDGLSAVDWDFITAFASRLPERAGIKAALAGSIWILGLTALVAFPLSVAAAIYLEEYAPKNWFTRLIQLNIANLAGVPSIVYGILGLTVFVRAMGLERSIISGALTLSILILPVIVKESRAARISTAAHSSGASSSSMCST